MNLPDESRFTVFSMNGLNLLIGFKGGIYSITPELYSFINTGECEPQNRDGMVQELKYISDREGDDSVPAMPMRSLRALCLNVTSSCNLACRYCFVDKSSHASSMMTFDTAKRAIDFLLETSSPDSMLQIDFFGGEPLLNKDLIKQCVEYAESSGRALKFTLTTNAVLLDEEILNWLNEKKISLILSLDGNKEINDKNRGGTAGNSHWDAVLSNILRVIKTRDGKDYYVRATYTADAPELCSVAKFFVDNGIYRFSLEAAKGSAEYDWAVGAQQVKQIENEYEKLAKMIFDYCVAGLPIDFFHFNVYLDTPLCAPRRLSGCGAGVEYISVSPEGELYPCHQLHFENFKAGDLNSGISQETRDKFSSSTIAVKKGCSECWARFYCSGGCHAASYFRSGDINIPDPIECELQRHRIKCAVWLEVMKKTALK